MTGASARVRGGGRVNLLLLPNSTLTPFHPLSAVPHTCLSLSHTSPPSLPPSLRHSPPQSQVPDGVGPSRLRSQGAARDDQKPRQVTKEPYIIPKETQKEPHVTRKRRKRAPSQPGAPVTTCRASHCEEEEEEEEDEDEDEDEDEERKSLIQDLGGDTRYNRRFATLPTRYFRRCLTPLGDRPNRKWWRQDCAGPALHHTGADENDV